MEKDYNARMIEILNIKTETVRLAEATALLAETAYAPWLDKLQEIARVQAEVRETGSIAPLAQYGYGQAYRAIEQLSIGLGRGGFGGNGEQTLNVNVNGVSVGGGSVPPEARKWFEQLLEMATRR